MHGSDLLPSYMHIIGVPFSSSFISVANLTAIFFDHTIFLYSLK